MAIVANTNVSSLIASRNVGQTVMGFSKSINKLSTGLRVAVAADDAAGLAVSEGLRSVFKSLRVASRNAADGISVTQISEGGMQEVSNILGRMKELATQAATGVLTSGQRGNIQSEFRQLQTEISRVASSVTFQGNTLLNGSVTNLVLQVGTVSTDTLAIDLTGSKVDNLASGASTTSVASQTGAQGALGLIDADISRVADARAVVASIQNRLDSTIANINIMAENNQASESRVRDLDFASEFSNFSKLQVLQQAGVSVLAQANQLTQAVLGLLR